MFSQLYIGMQFYKNLKEKVELINYNIKLIKYHIKDPEPGTLWYSFIDCRSYFIFRVLIYGFGVTLILIFFSIYRFIKEHESLVVFVYIIWFFSSLFYIEFLRL